MCIRDRGIEVERQVIAQLAQAGEGGMLRGDVVGGFGNRHQPAQLEVGQGANGSGQLRQFLRAAAGFAVLSADVDL